MLPFLIRGGGGGDILPADEGAAAAAEESRKRRAEDADEFSRSLSGQGAAPKAAKKPRRLEYSTPHTTVPKGCPQAAGANVSGRYVVRKDALRTGELQRLRRELTLVPKDTGCSDEPPEPLVMIAESATHVAVPRVYGLRRWGLAPNVTVDGRTEGIPMEEGASETPIRLCDTQPPQTRAVDAVMSQLRGPLGSALLCVPCGSGKTVMGIYVAAALGRKTMVVVTDRGLLQQWEERIATFLPRARVGRIQGPKCEWEESDVCVAMLHSICGSRQYPKDMYAAFGLIIVDEAHHIAARTFSRAVPRFTARHVLGLSATPDRSDGLDKALEWIVGPTAFRCVRPWTDVGVKRIVYHGGKQHEIRYKNGKLGSAKMITGLTKDKRRNEILLEETLAACREGRRSIILTERRDHIDFFVWELGKHACVESVVAYTGDMKEAERKAFMSTPYRVVVSILKMGKEALDKPELDTLVVASPIKAKYEQAVGRILRAHPDKKRPKVIDLVDPWSLFHGMARARSTLYRREKYDVETVHAD